MANRDLVSWRGYWPASTTPFDAQGHLDLAMLSALMDLYVSQGMHGIVVNGSSGEWFSQTTDERRAVADAAVSAVGGRVPVLVGCSSLRFADTLDLLAHAASTGAAGALVSLPPYMVPDEREAVSYFEAVAAASSIPIMAYNWPPGTNVDMSASLLERIAAISNVVAVKESTIDGAKAIETARLLSPEVRVFVDLMSSSGVDVLTQVGGDGYIGGGALLGRALPRFYEAIWRGDLAEARALGDTVSAFNAALTNRDWSGVFGPAQSQLKAAMNILGQPGGFPRFPRRVLNDDETLERLATALSPAHAWQ
jgi:4-hydroxy-tetrahydrodipicolinate synthase